MSSRLSFAPLAQRRNSVPPKGGKSLATAHLPAGRVWNDTGQGAPRYPPELVRNTPYYQTHVVVVKGSQT